MVAFAATPTAASTPAHTSARRPGRIRSFFRWLVMSVVGVAVLAACLAVALWDTVIMGRPMDEQLERE